MDANHARTTSVLMLPWLAHGHISPFLELAKKLTKRNFHIYLCSTPINLNSIKKRLAPTHSHSIKLIEINFPSSPDLPPHHHTTNGLPSHLMPALHAAFEAATPAFRDLINTLAPDLVVHDFNQSWATVLASTTNNIPAVQFITTGAAMASFTLHMINKRSDKFPFPAIELRGFHERQFRNMIDESLKKFKEKDAVLDTVKWSSNLILFSTFRELEGKYIDYLSSLAQMKIFPVGPLVQDIVDGDEDDQEIIKWLDKKHESSTVFVSFGSEYFLSNEEMEEVAHGLELSQVNFIWAVRFPVGEKIKVEEALPCGFIERVGERGLVVEGWAPQLKILAHSSTGGFVSHCGWNSIMESLAFGVPIIAMPMHLDQPPNARLLEEVGVALEAHREENGRLNREEMAQVIRKVVVEENGKDVRIKAKEFSETMRMKREEEIDEVVEELMKLLAVEDVG